MKKLLMLLAVVFMATGTTFAQDEHIDWVKLEQAQKQAKKDGKFTIIDMYTPWCGPCRMMENSTFSDPTFIAFVEENFHAVKFNAEGPNPVIYNGTEYKNLGYDPAKGNGRNSMHSLTRSIGIQGYPTIVVLDGTGAVVKKIVGFKKAADLQQQLTDIIKK
ncbi:MAG: thioredoxin fold domain-containing protein [Crocinitomicaceae bacterium]|nr:thioredoxin fold domain-containing protein [Crocinitomicaceae bacterium]